MPPQIFAKPGLTGDSTITYAPQIFAKLGFTGDSTIAYASQISVKPDFTGDSTTAYAAQISIKPSFTGDSTIACYHEFRIKNLGRGGRCTTSARLPQRSLGEGTFSLGLVRKAPTSALYRDSSRIT